MGLHTQRGVGVSLGQALPKELDRESLIAGPVVYPREPEQRHCSLRRRSRTLARLGEERECTHGVACLEVGRTGVAIALTPRSVGAYPPE